MRSSHWPILSNEKIPLAHLVKTKRTLTDELPIGPFLGHFLGLFLSLLNLAPVPAGEPAPHRLRAHRPLHLGRRLGDLRVLHVARAAHQGPHRLVVEPRPGK